MNVRHWRAESWVPELRAAGLEHRTPYSMRHTFAANAIAAGIATFESARVTGTSVLQIEKTYGHLLPDAIDGAPGLRLMSGRRGCRWPGKTTSRGMSLVGGSLLRQARSLLRSLLRNAAGGRWWRFDELPVNHLGANR